MASFPAFHGGADALRQSQVEYDEVGHPEFAAGAVARRSALVEASITYLSSWLESLNALTQSANDVRLEAEQQRAAGRTQAAASKLGECIALLDPLRRLVAPTRGMPILPG
jgi:hypothetical protein